MNIEKLSTFRRSTVFTHHDYTSVIRLLLVSFVVGCLVLLLKHSSTSVKKSKIIPGPPRRFLLGNIGQFNPVAPLLTFHKWAKQYGPIFQVKVGPQHIICVNDPNMAKELFEKRGSRYSSRNSPHVGLDLMSQGRRIAFIPSGPMHAAFRKQMHAILSISRTKENHKIQELESRQLLHELLRWSQVQRTTPDFAEIRSSFRRYTLSVMMTLAYGHRVVSLKDKVVETVFTIMDDMSRAVQPGQYFVDVLPILKKLPYFLRTWEHEVKRKLAWQWPFMKDFIDRTEIQMAKGIPNLGLIRSLVEQRKDMNAREREAKFLDDKCIAYQAMTLMEAGSDTTAITLMNFVMAMVLNPGVMHKGQKAVDAAVDSNRLPTFEDLPKMPYINQIVKEVMRWRPIINMGIPHSNPEEEEFQGYRIPKDSIIVGNIWAMQQDPAHYTDPEMFIPERHEAIKHKSTFESSMEPDANNRDHYIFGWGRRICPGLHLAEASVLLIAARLLWAFDIVPAKNVSGDDIPVSCDPATAYEQSIISNTKVFPVALEIRSLARAQVIRDFYEDAVKHWEGMNLDLYVET